MVPPTDSPVKVKAIKPADHKSKKKTKAQRAEVADTPQTFTWDGEEWTVAPSDATGLEFLAALEDERMVSALRYLLGEEQAARLIKGRKLTQLINFFEVMGEELEVGNP
jgi:hypothetical protein